MYGPYTSFSKKVALPLPPLSEEELNTQEIKHEEFLVLSVSSRPGEALSTATIFDMRMRRCYCVLAVHDTDLEKYDYFYDDPYWVDILKKTNHRGQDKFSTISQTQDGSLLLSDDCLGSEFLHGIHPPPSEPSLPHIQYTDLQNRTYLSGSVETCTWNGQTCIFKQIFLAALVARFDEQISAYHAFMTNPHVVAPSAYVVDEDNDMRGLLFPWAGVCIDTLPSVHWSYIRDLIHGLRDIHAITWKDSKSGIAVEASHGDIFCRNILVKDGKARWIDIGSPGYGYVGDSVAFADVLALLNIKAERFSDRSHMIDVETWLRDGMSFSAIAIAIDDWC